jgi:predicted phosphohydrolase
MITIHNHNQDKMKLRYLSDLHLEFIKPHQIAKFIRQIPVNNPEEICILAGDIGSPHIGTNYDTFMNLISKSFTKTFVIAGNHEYYHTKKTMEETNQYLDEYFKQFPNISYLNNQCEIYQGTRFIGTTLWSHITNPMYEINDVYSIPDFNYVKYNRLHRMSVDFLEDALNSTAEDCVVITHHVPSPNLTDVKYKTSKMLPYNQWFHCDMESLMSSYQEKIKCWVYGHTHTPSSQIIQGVPCVCNPIGYPNENKKVDFNVLYEIKQD